MYIRDMYAMYVWVCVNTTIGVYTHQYAFVHVHACDVPEHVCVCVGLCACTYPYVYLHAYVCGMCVHMQKLCWMEMHLQGIALPTSDDSATSLTVGDRAGARRFRIHVQFSPEETKIEGLR